MFHSHHHHHQSLSGPWCCCDRVELILSIIAASLRLSRLTTKLFFIMIQLIITLCISALVKAYDPLSESTSLWESTPYDVSPSAFRGRSK